MSSKTTILVCHQRLSFAINKVGNGLQSLKFGRMADVGTVVDGEGSAGSTLLGMMIFAFVSLKAELVEAFTYRCKLFVQEIIRKFRSNKSQYNGFIEFSF